MDEHTKGKLRQSGYSLRDESAKWVADTDALSRTDSEKMANAQRLAACWNMCEGISTENIEGGMTLVQRIGVYADDMAAANAKCREAESTHTALMAELAAARIRIAELDTQLGKRPCQNQRCTDMAEARALLAECLADVPATYVDPLIERIRAFLKGGA